MNPRYFQMMARYHARANEAVYDACAQLTDDQRRKDMGAFFGSIHNSLNHIYVIDIVWHDRFVGTPDKGYETDTILHDEFEALRDAHKAHDEYILSWANGMTKDSIMQPLSWNRIDGTPMEVPHRVMVYAQLFNHGTHHRGQIHCLLTQLGQKGPVLDVPPVLMDELFNAYH